MSVKDKRPFSGPSSVYISDPNFIISGNDSLEQIDDVQKIQDNNDVVQASNIFPSGTKVISLEFHSPKNYTAEIRLKCNTKEEFNNWLAEFQNISGSTFRVLTTISRTGQKVLYKAIYRCQHNTHPSNHNVKVPSKKHTGCCAKMNVTIKAFLEGRRNRSQDTLLSTYPTIVKIEFNHNHQINVAAAVKFKDPDEKVRQKFIELFKSRHTPSEALNVHKRDLMEDHEDDFYKVLADRSQCPDLQWVFRLYYTIFKEEYGETSKQDFFKGLETMVKESHIKSKIKIIDQDFAIVVCSPIMERIHTLKKASETVFIDSSGNMDRYNCRVFLLMIDSCVGGLPLAAFITSSESETIITTSLEMLVDILPSDAFGGAGLNGPLAFLTDDSASQQNSLKKVFPSAKIWLCTFHVLQAMWRWLWSSNHSIKMCDRRDLFMLFKKILMSENEEGYTENVAKFRENSKVKAYPNFQDHVEKYLMRSSSWSLRFRGESKGNNTNNIVEAAMHVLKDRILNRTRAFNVQQLFHYLTSILSDYYSQKILDIISERHPSTNKYVPEPKKLLDLRLLSEIDDIFTVQNIVAHTEYDVNVQLGICTCPVGSSGAPCKHQHFVAITKCKPCPNIIPLTSEEKMLYHYIAVGNTNVDPLWYCPLLQSNEEQLKLVKQSTCQETQIEANVHDVIPDVNQIQEEEKPQWEEMQKKIDEITDTFKENFKDCPKEFSKALDSMHKSIKKMKTKAGLLSAMHNFGKVQYTAVACKKSTAIPVQPTAVQRRKFAIGTRRCLQTGRPAKRSFVTEHGYSKRKKTVMNIQSKKKLPHSLQENVDILSNK